MEYTPIYLLNRAGYRLWQFISHWYVGGFLYVSHRALEILRTLDKSLALKVTLRHWLKPMYQDYTILGFVLGFLFRTIRIILGVIIYGATLAVVAAGYVIWALIPAYVIYRGFIK